VDRRRHRPRGGARERDRRRARAPLNPADVTAVVLTRDEAARLPHTLDALPQGMRVFVLDAGSSDDTAALAGACGAYVERRPWAGFVEARRYAAARVTTPWTLMLDADERIDATLREAILRADGAPAAYRLRRVTKLCGEPVRAAGWSNERLIRLFRTSRGRLVPHESGGDVHERWVVDGPVVDLPGTIVHDSYPTLASYRAKFDRYTSLEAGALRASRLAFAREVIAFPIRFVWLWLREGGWRDGWRGAFVAWQSARYRVVVRAKALRGAA
jgi:glycosyltransferase involved in cell wall biosynthesis